MSSPPDIITALTTYYRAVIQQPGIDSDALHIPPAEGWTIDIKTLREYGKTEAVIELLRRLPYLRSSHGDLGRVLIGYGTYALDYRVASDISHDRFLPGHCIHLSIAHHYTGYSRILDTERGTITNFHPDPSNNPRTPTQWSRPDDPQEWKRARTLPAVEYLQLLTHRLDRLVDMLAPNDWDVDYICSNEDLQRAPDNTSLQLRTVETEPAKDSGRAYGNIYLRHEINVYNSYLQHGWPDKFRKEDCRQHLLEEHDRYMEEMKIEMDKNNPEAHMFD